MALLEKKPDYLIAAFDTSGPTFRHELSTTYKENRPEMPDQLRPQIGNIRRMLPALGIPVLECEGWEAAWWFGEGDGDSSLVDAGLYAGCDRPGG